MTNSPIPFVDAASYPVRAGNWVGLLVDGERAFRRLCEAIEAAERSVWVTVTFMWPSFRMPDGKGTALDVLDRAAARGIDVRIIFWRPDSVEGHGRNAFWGAPERFATLRERRSGVKIRWDRAQTGYCQHQKSWLIDGGEQGEMAFVGGINLNPHSMTVPGHGGEGENHDVYLELRGPSAVDVHHNFVQCWNEASERLASDGTWGEGSKADLPFPTRIPAEQGEAFAQVQRTIHAAQYADGRAAPGAAAFNIVSGERSNFDQYCIAIDAARRSIYIENQYLDVPEIIERLDSALSRGVAVVLLLPAEPDGAVDLAARAVLGRHESFTLAGIAGLGIDGKRKPIYVHDKLMLIDDERATVGSCNLHRASLFGSSEMNVALRDPTIVRAMRLELFFEHLGEDTSHLDDRAALQLFRTIALENRRLFDTNDHAWRGLAFSLDIATYGR